MTDLLQALREATEPSRELDAEIHAWRMGWKFVSWVARIYDYDDDGRTYADFDGPVIEEPEDNYVPHYTSSIDAALELVPIDPETGKPFAWCIVHNADGSSGCWMSSKTGLYDGGSTDRTTPELAFCTAAIEARMKLREAA